MITLIHSRASLKTAVAALLLALVHRAHAQTPNPALRLAVVVDGSQNPGSIPDDVAYRHFLLSIAERANPTPAESKRREVRLRPIGLQKADHDALIQHLSGFRERLSSADPSEYNALLDSAASSLNAVLSPNGSLMLAAYVQKHIKSHTVLLSAPHPTGHSEHVLLSYRLVPASLLSSPRARLKLVQNGMNYNVSMYNDAWSDAGVVYGTSTTNDNSSGCFHGNYTTTAGMTTPGGNGTSQISSGMVSNVQLPLDSYGTYWVYGSVGFYCSCVNGTIGGGGGSYGYTPDLNAMLQAINVFDSWTDNGDGTVNVTTNINFQMLQDAYQCGCTNAPDFSDDPGLQTAIVRPIYDPYVQQAWRSIYQRLVSMAAWAMALAGQFPSPTGQWPGYNPDSPADRKGGWEPNPSSPGDFIRYGEGGSYETLHPDLNGGAHPPHWDYKSVDANGNLITSGRIYDAPTHNSGIYIPNTK